MPEEEDEVIKNVSPQGDVLNDNGLNVDHLGHVVYAEALADQVRRIKTPVTIGLFARWGSGKSFLLKHIQSKISLQEEERKSQLTMLWNYFLFFIYLMIFFLIALILPLLFLIHLKQPAVGIMFLIIGFVLLMFFTFGSFTPGHSFPLVIFYAFFTKLPIKPNQFSEVRSIPPTDYKIQYTQSDVKLQMESADLRDINNEKKKKEKKIGEDTKQKFIFVNYNAWHFAGCDLLWAGIVKALAEKIEEECGVLTTRLFRSISLETVPEIDYDAYQNQRHLFLEFNEECPQKNRDEKKLQKLLEECGGPVKKCQPYRNWSIENKKMAQIKHEAKCWVVEFKKVLDAKKAYKKLKSFAGVTPLFGLQSGNRTRKQNKPHSDKSTNIQSKKISFSPRLDSIFLTIGFLCVVVCSIVFTILAFRSNIFQTPTAEAEDEEESIVIKVLSILPGGVALFVTLARFAFAFFNSQENRINRVLQGAKKNVANELGFMNKIKEETEAITNLIQTIKLVYGISYKVVITVDDLDRVPLLKVKSVLEAVNILLSDRSSPFVCIVAIDSRVAINCFSLSEEDNDRPIVNGHEYLKKIINVPFCLPEIDNETKRMYIMGLIEEADVTTETRNKLQEKKHDDSDNSQDSTKAQGELSKSVESGNRISENGDSGQEHNKDNEDNEIYEIEMKLGAREIHEKSASAPKTAVVFKSRRKFPNIFRSRGVASANPGNALTKMHMGVAGEPEETVVSEIIKEDGSIFRTVVHKSSMLEGCAKAPEKVMEQEKTFEDTRMDTKSLSSSDSFPKELGNVPPLYLHKNFELATRMEKNDPKPVGKSQQQLTFDADKKLPQRENTNKKVVKESNQRAPINHKKFLYYCRMLMYEEETLWHHMHGNPRNIKRIFNVISLTTDVITALQNRGRKDFKKRKFWGDNASSLDQFEAENEEDNKAFAKDILFWILLTDQWPFRMSYIMEIIEDADQRNLSGNDVEDIPDEVSLFDIFESVVMGSEKEQVESHTKLQCLDGDLDTLYSLLKKTDLTKRKAKELVKYTINLDTNLRKSISLKRSNLLQTPEEISNEQLDELNSVSSTDISHDSKIIPVTASTQETVPDGLSPTASSLRTKRAAPISSDEMLDEPIFAKASKVTSIPLLGAASSYSVDELEGKKSQPAITSHMTYNDKYPMPAGAVIRKRLNARKKV